MFKNEHCTSFVRKNSIRSIMSTKYPGAMNMWWRKTTNNRPVLMILAAMMAAAVPASACDLVQTAKVQNPAVTPAFTVPVSENGAVAGNEIRKELHFNL